jgi:hypothetical protein
MITGTNLTGATSVTLGGVAATIVTNTDTFIAVVVGSGASGIVSVTTPGGTATLAGFTFDSGGSSTGTDTGVTTVAGTVADELVTISVPASLTIPLERGVINTLTSDATASIAVSSSADWTLNVADNEAATKVIDTGHMTASPDKVLTNSMHVTTLEPEDVDLATGGTLATGTGSQNVGFNLAQEVVDGDEAGEYEIEILFTVTASF